MIPCPARQPTPKASRQPSLTGAARPAGAFPPPAKGITAAQKTRMGGPPEAFTLSQQIGPEDTQNDIQR
jgi:hypothetical protein